MIHAHRIKTYRLLKCTMMLIGIALMVYAHQAEAVFYDNGSNNYDRSVSIFCVIWTGLVLVEYWPVGVLRTIAGVGFLGSLNMATDEFLFRPDIVGTNEYVSAIIICVVSLYNIILALNEPDGPTDSA